MRAVCLLRKAVVISARARASVIDIKRSTASACMMFVAQFERNPLRHTDFSCSLSCCHHPFLLSPSMCVQSIFNQPIYRAYAKIAQQQKNKMSREAPPLLLKLIRSMCDVIDNARCLYCCCRIYRHTYIYTLTICRSNDNNDYAPHPSSHPSFIFSISP